MNKEISYVKSLIQAYPKFDQQLNKPFEADAEIIPCRGGYLALSVDAISEEIEMNLIHSARTLGWLTVTASVSDLAAVGVLSQRLSVLFKNPSSESKWAQQFCDGINEAAKFYQIEDVSVGHQIGFKQLGVCTAFGWNKEKPKMKRIGLQAGDTLFVTGPIGWGNAIAFANLSLRQTLASEVEHFDENYRPKARLKEMQTIRQFAKVCIDTSDGLLSTVAWLENINQKKIQVNYVEEIFHPVAQQIARMTKVDPWLFFAAQNGEFELLFAIPKEQLHNFMSTAEKDSLHFIQIGLVKEGRGIELQMGERLLNLELGHLLDMLQEGTSPKMYVEKMLDFRLQNKIQMENCKWST